MMRRQDGFTLIEIMIVLVLTSLIAVMLLRWQWQQDRSLMVMDDRLTRQDQAATALAHLRRDLARADRLLPALSDVIAGPDVLISSRQLRDASGYARKDTAYVVYQVQQGALRRSVLGSDVPVLAQPMGRLSTTAHFDYLDASGAEVEPARSRDARSVRIDGTVIRLGGEGLP